LKILDRKLGRKDEYDGAADLGDSSVNAFSKEEYLSERNHASDRLAEVQHALKRIAKGTYGYSEVSGKPIPIERLEAMPSATTLVDEKPFI
jgi:DnaK suppressor protein